MNNILNTIKQLVIENQVRISNHGYDELIEDNIFVHEVIEGISEAILIEEYHEYPKGPCILTLQKDSMNRPIHVVWGVPKGHQSPAVLVTAYRPDPNLWIENFKRRKK